MTSTLPNDRKPAVIAAVAGGWVADAASLGLHWLARVTDAQALLTDIESLINGFNDERRFRMEAREPQ
jgi:hypothetical protein